MVSKIHFPKANSNLHLINEIPYSEAYYGRNSNRSSFLDRQIKYNRLKYPTNARSNPRRLVVHTGALKDQRERRKKSEERISTTEKAS